MTSSTPPRTPAGRHRVALVRGPLLVGTVVLGLAACGAPAPDATPSAPAPATTGASTPEPVPSASPAGPASSPSSSAPSASSSASPATPAPSCSELVSRLSVGERVGQLLMVAVTSTGLTAEQASVLTGTGAGSVVLLGNSTAGAAAVREVVADVREAADQPRGIGTLLAADQEGGQVQRLKGEGFSVMPSAARQSRLPDTELTEAATIWGTQLDAAGINADLAPVADVVPRALVDVNEPIGKLGRGYGSSPDVVAAKVAAVIEGLDGAGVATAVKHFPGLGRVVGNTDVTREVVDEETTRGDAGLAGFRAAVAADVDMVMVSSAVYARIDGRRPAVFSPTVVEGMLRDDLGFDGVVISDDLAAAAVQDRPPGRRVLDFVSAGGDLAIVGNPAEAATMADALQEAVARNPRIAARVDVSAARVLAMKERRGLADC